MSSDGLGQARAPQPPPALDASGAPAGPAPPPYSHHRASPPAPSPAEYIAALSDWLQLPPTTTLTALSYYHRCRAFCAKAARGGAHPPDAAESEKVERARAESEHLLAADPMLLASACVFLATKATDATRKMRDILNCYHTLIKRTKDLLDTTTQAYFSLRASLLQAESLVVRALGASLRAPSADALALALGYAATLRTRGGAAEAAVATLAARLIVDAHYRARAVDEDPRDLALAAAGTALVVLASGGDSAEGEWRRDEREAVEGWIGEMCARAGRSVAVVAELAQWLLDAKEPGVEAPSRSGGGDGELGAAAPGAASR